MKFIKELPFNSELDGDELVCGLWQSDTNACEYRHETGSLCDPSGLYYGTTDEREPTFCARHFYQDVVNGDGDTNYRLKDRK